MPVWRGFLAMLPARVEFEPKGAEIKFSTGRLSNPLKDQGLQAMGI